MSISGSNQSISNLGSVEISSGSSENPKIVAGTSDPSVAGVDAPKGSVYLRYATPGEIWVKTGSGNFDWQTPASADFAVIFDDSVLGTNLNIRSDRSVDQSPIDNTKSRITNFGSQDLTENPSASGATGIGSSIGGGLDNTASGGYATVPGGAGNTASGDYSYASGFGSSAAGEGAHAESSADAEGDYSHAENVSYAFGYASHAENGSSSDGDWSHSEGFGNSNGYCSHSEQLSNSNGSFSHAEGTSFATGVQSHSEADSLASGSLSHSEGESTAQGYASHAEGSGSVGVDADYGHAENDGVCYGAYGHAEGNSSVELTGEYGHAEGSFCATYGESSHSEGIGSEAWGQACHAEGYLTECSGDFGHAEGFSTIVEGPSTAGHAEGYETISYGTASHSQGWHSYALRTSQFSHASAGFSSSYVSPDFYGSAQTSVLILRGSTPGISASESVELKYGDDLSLENLILEDKKAYSFKICATIGATQAGPVYASRTIEVAFNARRLSGVSYISASAAPYAYGDASTSTWTLTPTVGVAPDRISLTFDTGAGPASECFISARVEFTEVRFLV